MTTVYFATNRANDPAKPHGYGSQSVPFDIKDITFAVADVTGIRLPDENSGTINAITDKTPANFSSDATRAIIGAKKNLLVFIHGFANSFEDAIKRAAFNREWFAEEGDAAADMTVIAFTWPSEGNVIAAPPHMPLDAYLTDQAQAGRSAFHIAYFLRVIDQLRQAYRAANPNGRIVLLAHSMGNHALSGAVQLWFSSHDPGDVLFDEAILAAADEIATTLSLPSDGQMTGLRKLAGRISIYYSRKDVAMYLSTTINLNPRLGFDGPASKHDGSVFPAKEFRIVDCTEVSDFPLFDPPDATHQYYRRSRIVRTDIVAAIAGCEQQRDNALSVLPEH